MNTKTVGEASEAAIMSLLLNQGKVILKPFGDNQRYDLVIDNLDGTFSRVQVKTGRLLLKQGVIVIKTSTRNRSGVSRSYLYDTDYIAVYCRELDKGYLIKTSDLPSSSAYLRVWPALYGRKQDVRNASDFEIPRIQTLSNMELMAACEQQKKDFQENNKGRVRNRKFQSSFEELQEMVNRKGYEATGRFFGVTGAAIKKRLRILKKGG